ncbi:MAG: hypothetical protein HPY66_2346 [Firmicutes bacterium]|nr:hypothetical protein [Bacillota bacterium]
MSNAKKIMIIIRSRNRVSNPAPKNPLPLTSFTSTHFSV